MWYWTKVLFLIFIGAILVWLLYELITFPSISKLRNENPTTSSMIEYRLSEARAEGKTLLVLDTVTDDPGERLYGRLGWNKVGVIPNYALYPDGRPCDTTVFWKEI